MNLGPLEMGIILLIVILLFGVGRLSKIGREMGSGIREFKAGLHEGEEDEKQAAEKPSGDSDEQKPAA